MNQTRTENMESCRVARREMGRHCVDCGEVQISSSHRVIHLYGRIRPMRGYEEKFEEAVGGLLKSLRQRSGVRDVITEWTCVI